MGAFPALGRRCWSNERMGFPVVSPVVCSWSLGGPVAIFLGRSAEVSSPGGLKSWGLSVSVGLSTYWEEVMGASLVIVVGEGTESSLELCLLSFWSSFVGSKSSTSICSEVGLEA